MNQANLEKRIMAWYDLASAEQRAAGKLWYAAAREFCRSLAEDSGLPVHKVAGVLAALSPSVYWNLNKRQCEALCLTFADGGPIRSVAISTYSQQADKAYAILETDHLSVDGVPEILGVRAFKTVAFYYCVLDPAESQCVAVDRHILSALHFDDFVQGSRWCYVMTESAFRVVAERLDMMPNMLQAIVWIVYKETAEAYSPGEKNNLKPSEEFSEKDLPF